MSLSENWDLYKYPLTSPTPQEVTALPMPTAKITPQPMGVPTSNIVAIAPVATPVAVLAIALTAI